MLNVSAGRAVARGTAALMVSASLAGAQEPIGARSFCLPGSAGQCFAFAINDVATGFDVWLRNLSAPADEIAQPFAVTDLTLRRVNAPDASGSRTDLVAGFTNDRVTTTGSAVRGSAGFDENTSAIEFPAVRTFNYRVNGSFGVLGCALPSPTAQAAFGFLAVTCGDRGLDGWLRIAFQPRVLTEAPGFAGITARPGTSADVAVQVAGCATHFGEASGVTTPFGGAAVCASAPFAESVVPEPAVVWLTGAGLAGVLAGRRVRRRGPGA
jgi:hypothetical protein